MNIMNRINNEQALDTALVYSGIENVEHRCLKNSYENGFFHLIVWTPYLRYEFYVDAADGGVAGIGTEPVPYPEALHVPGFGEDGSPIAA